MIQRIQTVFLLLVVICMTLMLFFPVWEAGTPTNAEYIKLTPWNLTLEGQVINFPYTFIATLAIASIVVALIEIFKYNNRLLQMKLGALNSLFMAASLGVAVYFYTEIIKQYPVEGNFGPALYLPAAAMIFNVLANRFIRKDERLVRSADRIR